MTQVERDSNSVISSSVLGVIEFGRPHTIVGTALAITVLFFIHTSMSVYHTVFNLSLLHLVLVGLATNFYIVGLNQLTDIEIDRINKPYLPLPGNLLTILQAKVITGISAVFALVASWLGSIILGLTITLALIIGTMYSIEPFRLKNRGLWGALSIVAVRAVLINLGISYHIVQTTGQSVAQVLNSDVVYLLFMITAISVVIAIFKDIPDLEGDDQFDIHTVVAKYGSGPVFLFSQLLIYAGLIAGIVYSLVTWHTITAAVVHGVMLVVMVAKMRQTSISSNLEVISAYKYIWYLFYLIYLIPLI